MRDNEAAAIRYNLYQSPFLAGQYYIKDIKSWECKMEQGGGRQERN